MQHLCCEVPAVSLDAPLCALSFCRLTKAEACPSLTFKALDRLSKSLLMSPASTQDSCLLASFSEMERSCSSLRSPAGAHVVTLCIWCDAMQSGRALCSQQLGGLDLQSRQGAGGLFGE